MMKMIYVLVMLCATSALVACGGDDKPAPAPTSAPTAVPTATSEPPTTTTAPSLPAVVPAEVPEPGSETEKVLAVYTKWIEAVRAEDWQGVADLCPPESGALTAERIGFTFNRFGFVFNQSGATPPEGPEMFRLPPTTCETPRSGCTEKTLPARAATSTTTTNSPMGIPRSYGSRKTVRGTPTASSAPACPWQANRAGRFFRGQGRDPPIAIAQAPGMNPPLTRVSRCHRDGRC